MPLKVLTICGSLRKGSFNAMTQRALPALAPKDMQVTSAPSFADFPPLDMDVLVTGGYPPQVLALADAMRAADGVIICSPEYNRTIPGALKNTLDWVSASPGQPFAGKAMAVLSASPSPIGAARMQYDLRKVLAALDAVLLNAPEVFIGECARKFDPETGALTDQATRDLIEQQLAAFEALIRRLRPGTNLAA